MSNEPIMFVSVAIFDGEVLSEAKSEILANSLNGRILLDEHVHDRSMAIAAGSNQALFVEALNAAVRSATPGEALSTLMLRGNEILVAGGVEPFGGMGGGGTAS
jgi:hypothetical protein